MRKIILLLFILLIALPFATLAHELPNNNQGYDSQLTPGMMQNQTMPQGMMQMMGVGRNYNGAGNMMWGFGGWTWLMWLGMLASALFWVLIIVLLIGLIRWVWKKGSGNPPQQQ